MKPRHSAILATLVSVFAGHAAHAQTADSAEAARPRALKLVIAADEAETAALEDSLHELLARLGIALDVSRAERLDLDDSSLARPTEGAIGTAWIDMRSSRARAVLVDHAGRVVARRDVGRDHSSAVVVEEMAHILQASVEELAEAERRVEPSPSPPPPERPPAPPTPAPPAKERVGVAVDGGGFFSGRSFGTGAEAVVGGGGMFGLSFGRGDFRPALWLLGGYDVAFDVRGRSVDIHTTSASLRVAPTLRLFGGRRWFVEAGPAFGLDVLWTTPRTNTLSRNNNTPVHLGDDSTDVSPTVGAVASAHLAVAEMADLFVALATDANLSPHRYLAMNGAAPEVVFEEWRIRPALIVGFTFTIAGTAQYAITEGAR